MPTDLKYGRVTLEHQRNIGDDEPVFVFRAQDATLPDLLEWYYALCLDAGSPENHLDGITEAREAVLRWQAEHQSKIPDSVGYLPGRPPLVRPEPLPEDPKVELWAAPLGTGYRNGGAWKRLGHMATITRPAAAMITRGITGVIFQGQLRREDTEDHDR